MCRWKRRGEWKAFLTSFLWRCICTSCYAEFFTKTPKAAPKNSFYLALSVYSSCCTQWAIFFMGWLLLQITRALWTLLLNFPTCIHTRVPRQYSRMLVSIAIWGCIHESMYCCCAIALIGNCTVNYLYNTITAQQLIFIIHPWAWIFFTHTPIPGYLNDAPKLLNHSFTS